MQVAPIAVLIAVFAAPVAGASANSVVVVSAKARIAASAPGLLVSLADGADSSVLPRGSVLVSRLSNAYVVPFSPRGVNRQIRALKSQRGVLTVQRNNRLTSARSGLGKAAPPGPCTTTPIDPLIDPIYSLRIDKMGPLPTVAATIAVLDSGIAAERNEFVKKIVSPFSYATGTSDITDTDGHGTAVAGVAAAIEGGIRGVSPASNIMPIKVLDANGETTSAILVQGIDHAIENGAGVINISAAGPASGTSAHDDATVTKAINEAFSRGIVVVAPTGNDGSEEPSVPSAYPHVLSVGGTDKTGGRASFSNNGESVDVMAPASMIPAPVPGSVCPEGYVFATGTSFSAPALSGAAAILKEMRPELSSTQIIDQFREGARDIGDPGWDLDTGFGAADLQVASTASAPERDGKEVDDDVYWVTGSRASKHKPVLTAKRSSKVINARISGYNDPTDVYRLSLKKRDKLTVVLSGLPGQTIILELWNKKAKNFDITERNVNKRRIAYRQGTGKKLTLSRKIAATATYYLAVSALTQENVLDQYTLSFKRSK